MSEFTMINITISNRVATISLNSPKTRNAFNRVMREEMIQVVKQIEADDAVRVVVLTGEGMGFSAGADLTENMRDYESFEVQCAQEYTPWLMGIHNSKKIYIAAVNGVAAGIGAAAALNCDLVMMADDAYLYQAFSAIGLMPDGGATWLFLQRLGYSRAFEMAVSAGKLDAQECLRMGIANKVVPADELKNAAQNWAEALTQGPPLAQAAVKQVMRKAFELSYQQTIEEESRVQSELIRSEDCANAVAAFFAKKPPIFEGK